ncbi:MAG TPA: TIGR03619 family F420-dependent LLM class oxidoreductase [Myxococcota bacterium]|nr:TIGR03619 family F420-dependent LLM class oxidoreductase [Myxococcota bacterium]
MKLGLYLRNMGPQSATDTIVACARAAEEAGIDDLWVADHIAIPPDDAEGSGGRYLDPLATLAFLAGMTRRIGLGTGVLVLPYRPPLATAKWIATIQELSGGRLLLGVGAGWMEAEFRAVGVPRDQRSKITDQTLAFLHRCFAQDEGEINGQRFLFRPRPARPPIFIGGAAPHGLRRSTKYGDGWMPMGGDPVALRPFVDQLRQQMTTAGKPNPEVVVITSLALEDGAKASDQIQRLAEIGATRVVHAWRYPDAAAFARTADALRRVLPA